MHTLPPRDLGPETTRDAARRRRAARAPLAARGRSAATSLHSRELAGRRRAARAPLAARVRFAALPAGGRSLAAVAALLGACAVLSACGGSDADRGAAAPAQVSSRPNVPMVVVPMLVGREQQEAHRIAARAGLDLRWTGFTGKLGNGRYNISCVKILSQSPVAGERRPRGAKIAVIEAACRTPNERPHGVARDGSTMGG
jgi:hypothetical protein